MICVKGNVRCVLQPIFLCLTLFTVVAIFFKFWITGAGDFLHNNHRNNGAQSLTVKNIKVLDYTNKVNKTTTSPLRGFSDILKENMPLLNETFTVKTKTSSAPSNRKGPTFRQTKKLLLANKTSTVTAITSRSTVPPQMEGPMRRHRRAVLIVSAKRSGSSFVGDIFNHHPDIFYIFEPLRSLTLYMLQHNNVSWDFREKAVSQINDSLNCRLRNGGSPPSVLCSKTSSVYLRGLCNNQGYRKPPKIDYTKTEIVCLQQGAVAMKLIRVQDLSWLEALSHIFDLRIIHLVRDPRPTELSRHKTRPNNDLIRRKGKLARDDIDLCENMHHNLKYWLKTPDWLKGKYMLVRYEDVAQHPYTKAREMLEFAGYSLHNEVVRWLNESTACDPNITKCGGAFSTLRNSTVVLNKWRKNMAWLFVKEVQEVCFKAMRLLGYYLIPDISALRNENFETTGPLPNYIRQPPDHNDTPSIRGNFANINLETVKESKSW